MAEDKTQTIEQLKKSYTMEVETVANYLAASVNLQGVLAEEVKRSLAEDITEELGHAQRLADRITQLGGIVPVAGQLQLGNSKIQPNDNPLDVEQVVRGVIADEQAAIEQYQQIIRETEGKDYVTQELCISLMGDEESHRAQFEGFLAGLKG